MVLDEEGTMEAASRSPDTVRTFIAAQLQTPSASSTHPARARAPTITVSREAGAGGHSVGEALVDILRGRSEEGTPPWTLFDGELVEKVLEDHDLPKALAAAMPEDRVAGISDTMDELFGLRPSSWTLVRKTADTILHLAALGNVVVIGRGANIITRELDRAFHVRLVASFDERVARIREREQLDEQEAARFVRRTDDGRRRYVKKYYGEDIEDPLLYDVVINTDRISVFEAARMIADAVSLVHLDHEPPGR
jgi:Cytidylate kinase-like family